MQFKYPIILRKGNNLEMHASVCSVTLLRRCLFEAGVCPYSEHVWECDLRPS